MDDLDRLKHYLKNVEQLAAVAYMHLTGDADVPTAALTLDKVEEYAALSRGLMDVVVGSAESAQRRPTHLRIVHTDEEGHIDR